MLAEPGRAMAMSTEMRMEINETIRAYLAQAQGDMDRRLERAQVQIAEYQRTAEGLTIEIQRKMDIIQNKFTENDTAFDTIKNFIDVSNQKQQQHTEYYTTSAQNEIANLKQVSADQVQILLQQLNLKTTEMFEKLEEKMKDYKGGKGGGKGDGHYEDGRSRLLSPKDNPVYKLRDGSTKDEFLHWKRTVEVHLESIGKWSGAAKVLKKMRLKDKEFQ